MGTGDIIGFTYLGMATLCVIIGVMVGTWRAVMSWGSPEILESNGETAFWRITSGAMSGLGIGIVWPLAIPALLVTGPAWHVRNKREQAETERKNTAQALREAANLYERGSEEWHMLRKIADETMAGKN